MEIASIEVRSRRAWRTWLEKHHASSPGIWLVYYKPHTGIAGVEYDDSVCEALCFGWVDSLIKRLDDDRYARKFTPRKPAGKWSESNRKRWLKMKRAGLLAPAGIAATPVGSQKASPPNIPDLPAYIAKALKADANAWERFRALAPSHRREYVAWIHSARKPETRERRLGKAIAMLNADKKLGLK
jgi:uncharacterized protein YdeI (YjbR/CyaY-like superfamily)